MTQRLIDIPMPIRGLSDAYSHAEQPPLTTRDALNVRVTEPATGRLRLSGRPGLTKHNVAQVNGANPCSALIGFAWPNPAARTFQDTFPPGTDWNASISDHFNAACACWGRDGSIYIATYEYRVIKLSVGGQVEWVRSIFAPPDVAWPIAIRAAPDGEHLYVAYGRRDLQRQGRVRKYRLGQLTLEPVWEWTLDPSVNVSAMDIDDVSVWVVGTRNNHGNGALWRFFDEGSLASVYEASEPIGGLPTAVLAWGGHTAMVAVAEPIAQPTTSRVHKLTSNGTAIYTFELPGVLVSDLGRGPSNAFYAGGAIITGGRWRVEKYQETTPTTATTAWTHSQATYHAPSLSYRDQMAVDRDGHVYISEVDLAAVPQVWRVTRLRSSDKLVQWNAAVTACDALLVDQARAPAQQSVPGVYAISRTPRRLVQNIASPADASVRSLVLLGVSNGDVRVIPPGAGAITTPSGGAAAMGTSLRWVRAVWFGGRVLMTDGAKDAVFDPVTTTVSPWRARRGAMLPATILEVWRGRVVRAGDPDNPQEFALSAIDDAEDWEYVSAEPTVADAVLGSQAPSGECPDIIRGVMPLTEDVLIFGGDRSIYRLTGDPRLGGAFDLLSREVGMAPGRAWCTDPSGVGYFLGARGGIYRITPGSGVSALPVTDTSVRKALEQIDLAANRVMLQWNDRDRGMHVWVTPWSAATTTHFFFHLPTESWWKDQCNATGHDPTAVCIVDGDAPGDRRLLLGCRDGFVRVFDDAAPTDDGANIARRCWLGPIQDGEAELGLASVGAVLGASSGPVDCRVYATDEPETPGAIRHSVTFTAGRNAANRRRARGAALYLELWAPGATSMVVEQVFAEIAPLGRARPR